MASRKHRSWRTRTRLWQAGLGSVLSAVVLAGGASAAYATATPVQGSFTITAPSDTGGVTLVASQLVAFAYRVYLPANTTSTMTGVSAVLSFTCGANGTANPTSMVVPIPDQTLVNSTSSEAPQARGLTASVPNACAGGAITGTSATMTGQLDSTDTTQSVEVDFEWIPQPVGTVPSARVAGDWAAPRLFCPCLNGGGLASTMLVPGSLNGSSIAPVLGGWAPVGAGGLLLLGAGAGFVIWRDRSRAHLDVASR